MLSTISQAGEKIDPRVRRTRKLLLDAFISLMAEQSFDEISVLDIAARATVNRATFYAHFRDKYELVDVLIGESFAQSVRQRLEPPASGIEEHVRRLLLAVYDYHMLLKSQCKHSISFRTFDSLVETRVKAQLRTHLNAGLRAYDGFGAHSQARLDLLATVVSWGIYGAAIEWAAAGPGRPAEAFADAALPLIVASIRALAGGPAQHGAR